MTEEKLKQALMIQERIEMLTGIQNCDSVHIGTIVEGDIHEADSFESYIYPDISTKSKGVTETMVWRNDVFTNIRLKLIGKFEEMIVTEIAKLQREFDAV